MKKLFLIVALAFVATVGAFAQENSAKDSFGIIDWNVAPKSSGTGEAIAQSAIKSSQGKNVVVMLVPNLSEEKMKDFLEETLKWYAANGYTFRSLG
jgi:hypothetical protein